MDHVPDNPKALINDADELVTLKQAAQQELPEIPSPNTFWRWQSKGLCGIRLRTVKIGRKRYTTLTAFREFLSEVAAAEERRNSNFPERS